MSFVIDEDAIQRILEKQGVNAYTVTAFNLGVPIEPSPVPLFPNGVSSTVSVALPNMSFETIEKLLDLRKRIVDSGSHLLTTEELDNEVAERKGWLPGD